MSPQHGRSDQPHHHQDGSGDSAQGWNVPDTPRQSLPEPGRHLRWISPSRHLVDTFPDCREITNLQQSPYEPLA
ncbi:MAG: hypothetical protein OXD45_12605 [Rhodobacteraceae bacterium]|nr:hypothetical protein [Paracoccaceae bacterium]